MTPNGRIKPAHSAGENCLWTLISLNRQWLFRKLSVLAICALLGSCTLSSNYLPRTTPVVDETTTDEGSEIEEQGAITHAFVDETEIVVIEDPWELVDRANGAEPSEVPELLIRATEEFLNRGQLFTAETLVTRIQSYPLSPEENYSLQFIRARLASEFGQHKRAMSLLFRLNRGEIHDLNRKIQYLGIIANSQIALDRTADAVNTLLELDPLLADGEQLENQRQLLKLLQSMDDLQIALLRENSSNNVLEGWLALVDTLKATTPTYRKADIESWRSVYLNHPVQVQLLVPGAGSARSEKYNQIALLLPLTSQYGNAAKAFYDGFMQAHASNYAFHQPQVLLYDIGEESFLTSFYYQAAVKDGADFVVGPLGRDAAENLLNSQQPAVPTLVIAEIPEQNVSENLFGISLSPEQEAAQVAQKAFADGHRQATIFRSESEWGQRVANAFAQNWQDLGGIVVKNSYFPKDISDYTRIIQQFLDLDESIVRHRLVEAKAGISLKFTPRRRDDMDLLFLAANAGQGRLVVPQLRFFQAHDLPIYATSYIFDGDPNPGMDADLDGLIFGDMKWMLDSVAIYKEKVATEAAKKQAEKDIAAEAEAAALADEEAESENNDEPGDVLAMEDDDLVSDGLYQGEGEDEEVESILVEPVDELAVSEYDFSANVDNDLAGRNALSASRSPYQNSSLDRLYALGLQSYPLIPQLITLRKDDWGTFYGEAMTVSVNPNGSVERHPTWAKFESGLAEPINPVDRIVTD